MAAGGADSLEVDATSSASLMREGTAMLRALIEDFAAVPSVQVVTMYDRRVRMPRIPNCDFRLVAGEADEQQTFRQLAAEADWTLVVAPEMNHILLDKSQLVESVGGRLLSAGLDAVQVGSDKNLTARRWNANQVPHPPGVAIESGSSRPTEFCFPAILKPTDGAGSVGITRIQDASQWKETRLPGKPMRMERHCAGLPASVAIVHGPSNRVALPAFSQEFVNDNSYHYLGGRLLVDDGLRRRACELALKADSAIQTTTGYTGVDMVLGDDPDGGQDVAIELNPRVTTSYIGLRHALDVNLANLWLALATRSTRHDSFNVRQSIEFTCDGTVVAEPVPRMQALQLP